MAEQKKRRIDEIGKRMLTMAEYITKDKAKELVCDFCQWAGTANCEECEHPVDDSPSADVRPVVHGEWHDMGDFISCSVCHCTYMKEFESYYGKAIKLVVKTNYCPDCGAKMEG